MDRRVCKLEWPARTPSESRTRTLLIHAPVRVAACPALAEQEITLPGGSQLASRWQAAGHLVPTQLMGTALPDGPDVTTNTSAVVGFWGLYADPSSDDMIGYGSPADEHGTCTSARLAVCCRRTEGPTVRSAVRPGPAATRLCSPSARRHSIASTADQEGTRMLCYAMPARAPLSRTHTHAHAIHSAFLICRRAGRWSTTTRRSLRCAGRLRDLNVSSSLLIHPCSSRFSLSFFLASHTSTLAGPPTGPSRRPC